MNAEKVRESVIAGSWYPGDPKVLGKDIERYMERASASSVDGKVMGLIVPHAGYMYSGGVAAHAYKLLKAGSFDRVVVVAPSHRAYFDGASIYKLGGYRTPLGVVPLDRELVDALFERCACVRYVPQAHAEEHSLEIQLPFLQTTLGDFKLTPIIMGDQSLANCEELGEALADVCRGKNVLLVASSDLSHYHSHREAEALDRIVIDRISAMDPRGLIASVRKGESEACGAGPIATVMLAASKLGADSAKILRYADSGEVTGDEGAVVGYLSAVIYSSAGGCKVEKAKADALHEARKKSGAGIDLGLTDSEKTTLRQIAREAIKNRCLGAAPLEPEKLEITSRLEESRGAFVTLHKGGELRGCIGLIEGRGPLHKVVREMAVQAAFGDPRFPEVRPDELERLELEISVLTPLERIADASRIEIGRHGLLIRKGWKSGLLLPQVAVEQGWDRIRFLEYTCRKAGLPLHAWKDPDAEIYMFSADIF